MDGQSPNEDDVSAGQDMSEKAPVERVITKDRSDWIVSGAAAIVYKRAKAYGQRP